MGEKGVGVKSQAEIEYIGECMKIMGLSSLNNPWVGKISWRRKWQPTPVFLPGKSHGWRSLVGYSLWGRKSRTRLSDFNFTITLEVFGSSSTITCYSQGLDRADWLRTIGKHLFFPEGCFPHFCFIEKQPETKERPEK